MKTNISFILFTYNEEKRLPYVIKNFIKYGDIYILDGGSTDKTQEVAESLGAKFFTRPKSEKIHGETEQNLNFVKSIINTDWIYWGYVDNIAPKKLLEIVARISSESTYKLINVPLYTHLWGNTENYIQKSYGSFFFHKDYIDFTNNYTHGFGKFLGKDSEKLTLESNDGLAIKHFSTYSIHKFILNHLRYAEDEAFEKYEKGERFSLIKTIVAMIRYIFIYYREGHKYGTLGILIVLNYAFFRLMTYTKLYELENNINLDTIENNYSKNKEVILKDF
ncbi:glycosyltransferase [Candidatus Gracilibacteria bacterium]|nr:glycosyltransferase [Candidatus Gracilibacteria bacterium]MCF7898672.1 glycosyltransferase [Candidatus Paceibacterota bacterium]